MEAASEKLFEEFDQIAKQWGWIRDQGYGSEVKRTEEEYNEAKAALIKHIEFLEGSHDHLSD